MSVTSVRLASISVSCRWQSTGAQGKEAIEEVNAFVGHVFGDSTLAVRADAASKTVLITNDGIDRDLDHVGKGLQQALIIAIVAHSLSGHWICVEEPELHLHPIAQRRLLEALARTENQYLIATHSGQILGSPDASISRLVTDGTETVVERVASPGELRRTTDMLGYRASDIVQANAIVFVEGPSDRIYVRRWLRNRAPELQEGIHFVLLSYGGSLISDLSIAEPAGLLTSLLHINRNIVVISDSDQNKAGATPTIHQERIAKEFRDADSTGFLWVTNTTTIEGYLPRAQLEKALKTVHPSRKLTWTGNQWVNPLGGKGVSAPDGVKKTMLAKTIDEKYPKVGVWRFGLDESIDKLALFIRNANR